MGLVDNKIFTTYVRVDTNGRSSKYHSSLGDACPSAFERYFARIGRSKRRLIGQKRQQATIWATLKQINKTPSRTIVEEYFFYHKINENLYI